jgi:hypothetical protein
MTTKSIAVWTEKTTVPLVLTAVSLGLLTIGLETVLHIPMKLPGHRAFVGALALLVCAEAFAPLILVAFAGAVSTFLVVAGGAPPISIAVWMAAALVIWKLGGTRLQNSVAIFLLGGLVFGFFRYLALMKGFHHTPELIRLGGHLGFGGAGGLISFGIARTFSGGNRD